MASFSRPSVDRRKTSISRKVRLALVRLEDRAVPSSSVRSIDGTGNNLSHSNWGSAGVDLLRKAPTTYANGTSMPTAGRPDARVISNTVADQGSADIISQGFLSAMSYAWGQFVDHDLDLTPAASPEESFNIQVPTGDPYFDPYNTGTQVIPLDRSLYDTNTGTTNPRQQINTITAWLDGSQIYGSDDATASKLRTHVGGRLKTSAGNMLPFNNAATFPTGTLPMANDANLVPEDQLYAAGDVRANENIELTSLQTIFVREHNRIADQIHAAHPTMSDENIYQQARAYVIAELEVITYQQWLPTLLGPNAVRPYQGYKPNVNPGIANEFSTAAFRLGHSMLGDDVEFLDNNGNSVAPSVTLAQAFFNPPLLAQNGVDSVLKYLSSDPASEIDSTVVNSVRNFLFGPPGSGGLDLASLNIQRGRDHGLADYNSIRAAYGLPRLTSFSQITSNVTLRQKLSDLYGGNINNIDAWVGGLAEDHAPGSNAGPLITRVLADQFERLRDGDRFWYQRTFSGQALWDLQHTTLTDIIRRNTGLTNLQGNLFQFHISIAGTVYADVNGNGHRDFHELGLPGRVIQLVDVSTGDVIATTVTSLRGDYHFDTLNGLGIGSYRVQEVLPTGWVLTSQPLPAYSLTRGDVNYSRADFGNRLLGGPIPFSTAPLQSQPSTPLWYDNSTHNDALPFTAVCQSYSDGMP